MPGTVQRWTGRESRALHHALRMSVRVFAAHLGVTDRAVSKWEAGNGDRVPGPDSQAILDTVFEQADENARSRFWEELGQRPVEPVRGVTMVPDMDPAMIARPDLQALVDIVLEASAAASGHVVAIAGPGGFGKTTLATQAVHAARIREAFPEILWVETGEDCSPTQVAHLISDLCFHLDGTRPELSDPEQAGFHLARVVGDRKMLLVIDNVWSGADLSPFLMGGPSCVRVVTTRNIRVTPTRARVLRLGPMRQDEIAELLRRTVPDASSSMLGPVAALCGGWPLLATLVGASVSGDVCAGATTQQALDIVSRALRAQGPQALDVWDTDQRKVAISHVISTTLRALDDSVRIPVLHLKPSPYYVSDATTADLLAVLRRLAAAPGAAAAISGRAQAALATDRLKIAAHDFWCAPGTFRDLPVDLADDLSQAVVVIVKGDLNYRRLVGDAHWDPVTPFADVTGYFPAPVAALRTCKSDVAVGVPPERLAHLEATAPGWRTDGAHAVIHVRP
jgi:hypothetical protein